MADVLKIAFQRSLGTKLDDLILFATGGPAVHVEAVIPVRGNTAASRPNSKMAFAGTRILT